MFSTQIVRVVSPFHFSIRQVRTGSASSQHPCPRVQEFTTLIWFNFCYNLHTRSPFGFRQPVSMLRIAPQFVVQAHSCTRNCYAGLPPAGYSDFLAHPYLFDVVFARNFRIILYPVSMPQRFLKNLSIETGGRDVFRRKDPE